MSTTQQNPAGPSSVTNLEQARERRARALLDRRDELARRWAQALSHNRPDADDLAYEIAVVEEGISKADPSTFDALFREWIVADASRLHEPGTMTGSCVMCDVARGGVA